MIRLLVPLLALATVAAIAVTGGNVGAAAAPVVLVSIGYAMWRVPLRWSASVLIVLGLSLDGPGDAQNEWRSPVHALGTLLNSNLGNTVGLDALKISGLEVILFYLLLIALHRKVAHDRIDRHGQVETASVLWSFALLWLAAIGAVAAHGLASGGDPGVAILQVRPLLMPPLLFVLFQAAFRGPRDHVRMAVLVLAGAAVKACFAIWVRATVVPVHSTKLEYATSHGDSITFALACTALLVYLAEKTDRKRLLACVLLLPLLVGGMLANARRMVWVELLMASALVFVISPWRPWKRALARTVIVATPIMALYLAVGWSSSGRIFQPVQLVRSIVDSKGDRSTLSRDVENHNLITTLQAKPLLGRGFGHEYVEHVKMDDISRHFPQYRSLPHNSILGLLVFCGLFGFVALCMFPATVLFLAARAYHRAAAPVDRAAALCAVSAVLVVAIQAYGDMGIVSLQSSIALALAATVAGKLAPLTGAWPSRASWRPAVPGLAASAWERPAPPLRP